jgi:tetratricopeptide (TPR) repeat protein
MKLRLNLFIYFLLGICLWANARGSTDSLLNKLNAILADKDVYVKQKQSRIEALTRQVPKTTDLHKKYALCQKLFEEYKAFSYDSAYTYAKKLQVTAAQLNDPVKQALSKMELGFTLLSSGMFKETLETLNHIDVKLLADSNKIDYYFLKARSYFDLSDFDRNSDYSAIYNPKGIQCIDSALNISKPGSYYFLALNGLKDLRTGDNTAGAKDYTTLLSLPNLTPHQFAVNACSLSYIYEVQGKQDESIALLIKAAIADIQSATKETVAMYKLADYLYKKGDLKNAYTYINQAMDEAIFYGARHRQVTISSILPIIESQRISIVEQQRKSLFIYSSIITLLVIFVVAFAYIIFRQLKKLRIADDIIKTANASLQENNVVLEELNRNLSIANKIKNEYIGYYFNINSIYIEKLESFQKSLDKKLSSKRYEDAQAAVKNLNLENERLQLFHTFDKVFLRLFPDFIRKFNLLFNDDEEILIPEGQLLGTEHRIFALIRMGIHDNERIAKLLGYSVNTIYSYKNRIKNRSFIANDEFEDRIMAIEAV